MSAGEPPPFPKDAFAEAARVYARSHNLVALASRCGTRKPGFSLQRLPLEEVIALFADQVADVPLARRPALKELLRGLGGDREGLADTAPSALRRKLGSLPDLSPQERGRWIALLLSDARPEVWKLIPLLDQAGRSTGKESATARLRRERDEAVRALETAEREAEELHRARARVEEELDRSRAQAARLEGDVRRLRQKVGKEVELRKLAERRRVAAEETARAREEDASLRKAEVLDLRRRLQVRDAPGTARQWRDLWEKVSELEEKYESLSRNYSALKVALRALKTRIGDSWEARKIREKDLRPRDPDEVLTIAEPIDVDSRPAEEKIRIPADPHHWPGGRERFERFLVRLARSPHVTRVVPQSFQHATRHGVAFVSDEGDVVVRVSEGDHAARVLVLTTAVHRGEGEFVRRALESVFEEFSL
jgi:hypothetical protein